MATPDAEIPVSSNRGDRERERWPPCLNSPTARPARSPQCHRSRSGRSGSHNGEVMASRGEPRSIGWPRVGWATMPEQPDRNRGPRVAELMQKRAAEEVAQKAERAAQEAALRVVERWNAERSPLWSPTIRCAIVAGTPWLDVYCPGCGTSRAIDIRALDRHPLAAVGSLVIGLRCSWCPGNAPMPVSPGCTRCRRPRGGAKVCQWNSSTSALSAQRTLKGSA